MVEALCYKPKVAGSSLDEVIEFFNLPNPAALWPWVQRSNNMSAFSIGGKRKRIK
jgi:hypothetical protein